MKKIICLCFLALSVQAQQKPNIVFIFSDDLSFRDLSVYGQNAFKTPNLDALARQSTRFTQAYAAAPECAPSRGCLLSGVHVGRGPIRINSSARGFEYLPDSVYTFAEMLKANGYTNGVVGKWGVGYRNTPGNPLNHGFDYHFGYLEHFEAHSYFPWKLYENNKDVPFPGNKAFDMEPLYVQEREPDSYDFAAMYDADGKLKFMQSPNSVYATDVIDQKALAFISNHKKNPFFLFFTTNLPHGPAIVDDLRQLKNRQEMDLRSREWGAMVERLDISVGKLMARLKDEGVYDNTMIIFASDNGYAMHNPQKTADGQQVWPDDEWLHNKGDFYGGKFTVREAGMRIPMFVHLPGQQEARAVGEPVWLVDFFPTFADVISIPKPKNLDGYSLLPLLKGQPSGIPQDRSMYFYKNNEQSVRQGAWFGFREHPQKPLKLYLLEEDQDCEHDLTAYYPELAKDLGRYLDTVHQPHPWYWNPGETQADFQKKVKRATETSQLIQTYRPNGMTLMPWEKK